MKYRKYIDIEAYQIGSNEPIPDWFKWAYNDKEDFYVVNFTRGWNRIENGYWVIKNEFNEIRAETPDNFNKLYHPMNNEKGN